MTESQPPDLPPGPLPGPPARDPGRFDQLEFKPPVEKSSSMNPVLKGCLMAILYFGAVILLLVSACFGLILIN